MRLRTNQYWPILLSFPLGLLAAIAGRYAILLPWIYAEAIDDNPSFRAAFQLEGVHGLTIFLAVACGLCAVWFLAASLLGLGRGSGRLKLVRIGYIVAYVLGGIYLGIISKVTWHIVDYKLPVRGVVTSSVTGFFWWYQLFWPVAVAIAGLAFLHLMSWRRSVINVYTGSTDSSPAMGDRVLENFRTHGREPIYRKCLFGSLGVHVMVIVVLPWLFSLRGCVQPYRVPKGRGTADGGGSPTATGNPAITQVKIVKAQVKKKSKRKLMVNPHSAISFHVPDLDESGVDKAVEQATELTYQADPTRVLASATTGTGGAKGFGGRGKGGGLGAGGPGTGGWPDGMENALVRFIRLEYNGAEWDTGMDAVSRADMNFLAEFHKLTGFKVAQKGESHSISLLRKYPKGMAPPFVFMTGSGGISVSGGDMKILREYLLGGGMLFANCGSPQFDREFRAFLQQVLPGNPLLDISNDDPIYQAPNVFPRGAPPFWHHGGMRALGVKYRDRWCVFYHPGDIVDAWKTGHSGLSPELTDAAFELGENVVYYSFTHYLEMTRQYRK